MIKNKKIKVNSISVVVTNTGPEAVYARPEIDCSGFGAADQSLTLGEHKVKAGDSRSFQIKVKDLPIQSHVNAGQLRAALYFRSAERKDDKESLILSPIYAYVFDEIYETATLYAENQLIAERGTVLMKATSKEEKGKLKIGKVKNKDGVFEDLIAGSDAFAIRDNAGNIIAQVEEVGIEYASDDPDTVGDVAESVITEDPEENGEVE